MDDERSSDTEETFDEHPPSAVSDQNAEEPPANSAGASQDENRGVRDSGDDEAGETPPHDSSGDSDSLGGESGEGSQSTGNPRAAG